MPRHVVWLPQEWSSSIHPCKLSNISLEWCLIGKTQRTITQASYLTSLGVVIKHVPQQVFQLLWEWSSRMYLVKLSVFSLEWCLIRDTHWTLPGQVVSPPWEWSSSTYTGMLSDFFQEWSLSIFLGHVFDFPKSVVSLGRLIKYLPRQVFQLILRVVSSWGDSLAHTQRCFLTSFKLGVLLGRLKKQLPGQVLLFRRVISFHNIKLSLILTTYGHWLPNPVLCMSLYCTSCIEDWEGTLCNLLIILPVSINIQYLKSVQTRDYLRDINWIKSSE